ATVSRRLDRLSASGTRRRDRTRRGADEHALPRRRGAALRPRRALPPRQGGRRGRHHRRRPRHAPRLTGHPTRTPDPRRQSCTPRVSAPSTTRLVPVMKLAAGLARNATALATSCGVPMRPVGFSDNACSKNSGLFSSLLAQMPPGKYVLPGETLFALIGLPASWWARPCV